MSTDTKRRLFLRASLSAGAVGMAVGTGLLAPGKVLAAWNEAAFKAESVGDALKGAFGSDAVTDSAEITMEMPDNPENGAAVPVDTDGLGRCVRSCSSGSCRTGTGAPGLGAAAGASVHRSMCCAGVPILQCAQRRRTARAVGAGHTLTSIST